MLDSTTKKRIDDIRDILVGKVTNPIQQVEQITVALIYKFMDDMDMESVELGGERKFFSHEYEKFAWSKLFKSDIGGEDRVELYSEALVKMELNPYIPQLFRNIFKRAFLPYRDPETLRNFLKYINDFTYSHSEKLGDAFEYLLSILGSQGDAGQFRTPRHIIDFMAALIDPQKGETILDPACGTAGFLISAYKHILKTNSSNYDAEKDKHLFDTQDLSVEVITVNGKLYKGDKLTPDERKQLTQNVHGYDISPDMVRLSLVNMYLHGFPEPHIYEYDTLTSDDRWNEFYDVILANPPFMSPKGGIRPHKRFSVQSKRSEVLFVDYMAEHLTANGRAAIVVPEGIIFQTGTAYKNLRKMLVDENYLVGVISLPAGVFQPYSGVKTSILWLDKKLARKTDNILFAKITNDGFDLGAQRRPINQNDLPEAFEKLTEYRNALQHDEAVTLENDPIVSIVSKIEIKGNGDYNLSGERYKVQTILNTTYELVELQDVCEIKKGSAITKKDVVEGNIPVIAGGQSPAYYHNEFNRDGETITVSASGAYSGFVNYFDIPIFASDCSTIKPLDDRIKSKFLYYLLKGNQDKIYNLQVGMGQPHVYPRDLNVFKIPLPPLSVQEEIVAEIESYQKIIDGARQVVDNYKPHIDIDPDWEMVELGEIAVIKMGQSPPGDSYNMDKIGVPLINGPVEFGPNPFSKTKKRQYTTVPTKMCKIGDLILCVRGSTTGRMNIAGFEGCIGRGVAAIRSEKYQGWINNIINIYRQRIYDLGTGSTFPNITTSTLNSMEIPLPPIETQQQIVARIEQEQQLVAANKQLIELYEQKIKDRIGKVWGE